MGAVGCTISFANIYEDIVKNNYKYSIIFEDDIDWNKEHYGELNKETFDEILTEIDSVEDHWDICYLGTESIGKIEDQRNIKNNICELEHGRIEKPITDKTFNSFNISRRSNKKIYHSNFGGQQAFILTLNGAKQVLKYHNPAYTISDGLMSYAIMNHDIKNISFIPTYFTQLSHPRIGNDGKLWQSSSCGNSYTTNKKYDPDEKPCKKGNSEWVVGMKYDKPPPDWYIKHTKTKKEDWLK